MFNGVRVIDSVDVNVTEMNDGRSVIEQTTTEWSIPSSGHVVKRIRLKNFV